MPVQQGVIFPVWLDEIRFCAYVVSINFSVVFRNMKIKITQL